MQQNFDVIIVGSGIAGLYTALNLDPKLKVLLLAKRSLSLGNSSSSQGGIAAVLEGSDDSTDSHLNDSLIAGGFKNNTEALKILVTEGPRNVRHLMDFGVEFDRKPDGSPDLALEGGHSHPRILRHKDATGREITEKLIAALEFSRNITVWENAMVCGLRTVHNGFSLDILREEEHVCAGTYACVLATGGVGRVYEHTTNSAVATGDGILLASSVGAKLRHMEWVQFHPTGFADNRRECLLIPEAVRGAGAVLVNAAREPFLTRYDPRAELAPRDVISRAMVEEGRRLGDGHFYLDFTMADDAGARQKFPYTYANLAAAGIAMTRDLIPVCPCQHYLMGGIDVDLNGESSVHGLYAVGECAHTGVHGSSRLAGNSMLEDIVFAHQTADQISRRAEEQGRPALGEYAFPENFSGNPVPKGFRTEVRALMQKSYFVIPDPVQVVESFERIREMRSILEKGNYHVDRDYLEAKALANAAYLILKEVL